MSNIARQKRIVLFHNYIYTHILSHTHTHIYIYLSLLTRTHKFHKSVYTVHTLVALGPAELFQKAMERDVHIFCLHIHLSMICMIYARTCVQICTDVCVDLLFPGVTWHGAQLWQAKEPEKDAQHGLCEVVIVKKSSVSLVICRLQMIFIQLLTVTGLFFIMFSVGHSKKVVQKPVMWTMVKKTPISIDRSILDLHTWPSYKRTKIQPNPIKPHVKPP